MRVDFNNMARIDIIYRIVTFRIENISRFLLAFVRLASGSFFSVCYFSAVCGLKQIAAKLKTFNTHTHTHIKM